MGSVLGLAGDESVNPSCLGVCRTQPGSCRHSPSVILQLKDGDTIRIDAETRSMDVTSVDEAEWARRREEWKEPPLKFISGVLYKYIKNVTSASIGCVTDI